MIRMAAFDMDGTLLLPDHSLGADTLSTLRRLNERGITLVFATGRHVMDMAGIIGNTQLNAWLITGNGTRIHNPDGRLFFGDDLPPDVARKVLHTHWDTAASLHVFNDSGWFTSRPVPEMLGAYADSGFSYQLIALRDMPVNEVTKACFCGEHDDLVHLREELMTVFAGQAHICFSAWQCLEVLPLASNKGSALRILSEHKGMTMAQCMAFGDAMNDKEMLEHAGQGLIMGNAMPELRAALPGLMQIGHCSRQAVAHYLNHWLDTPHLAYSPEA